MKAAPTERHRVDRELKDIIAAVQPAPGNLLGRHPQPVHAGRCGVIPRIQRVDLIGHAASAWTWIVRVVCAHACGWLEAGVPGAPQSRVFSISRRRAALPGSIFPFSSASISASRPRLR